MTILPRTPTRVTLTGWNNQPQVDIQSNETTKALEIIIDKHRKFEMIRNDDGSISITVTNKNENKV